MAPDSRLTNDMSLKTNRTARWEIGGDFHIPAAADLGRPEASSSDAFHWNDGSTHFYGSGTAALLDLCLWGIRHLSWRRLLFPSYYCKSVIDAMAATGVELALYPDSPMIPADSIEFGNVGGGDAIVLVNYFGWRGKNFARLSELNCHVIEDHTHDPIGAWSRFSRADFCFASLRKYFPIPDGAVLWSPKGMKLPPPRKLHDIHRESATRKMDGMSLKALYLAGDTIKKDAFRGLLLEAEAGIVQSAFFRSAATSSAIALMSTLSPSRICRSRRRNYKFLVQSGEIPHSWLKAPDIPAGCSPFSLILVMPSNRERNRIRSKLIEKRIYPSILWDEIPRWDRNANQFSRRMLSIACDHRYRKPDMQKLLAALKDVSR